MNLLHETPRPACRAAARTAAPWIVALVALLPALAATQGAQATPLALIFDEVWQEPLHSSASARTAAATAAMAAGLSLTPPGSALAGVILAVLPSGLISVPLDLKALGTVPAVSDDMLSAQVSASMSALSQALRLGRPAPAK